MFRSVRRLPRRVPIAPISARALRPFTCGYPRTMPVQPPVSTTLPSDAYQLLFTQEKAGESEDALYDQQIRDVESWWSSPRYEGIKRPYTAADVVSKRGSLQQTYPSSLMARKLFNLLNERAAAGQPVHTSEYPIDRAEL
jgi:isocitrate lyase